MTTSEPPNPEDRAESSPDAQSASSRDTAGSPPEPTAEQPPAPQYAPPQYPAPQYPDSQYAPPQYPPPQQVQQPHPYGQSQYQAPFQRPQYQYAQYRQAQYQQPQYQQTQYAHPQYVAPLPPAGADGPFDGARHALELNRPLYGASMGQAFSRFFRNYANFSGRASRSEYWWMALWSALIALGFLVLIMIIGSFAYSPTSYSSTGSDIIAGFFGLLLFVLWIGTIIPTLALSWRRLHDANLAGPFYFLTLIPYVGWLVVLILTLLPPRPEGRRFDLLNR